MHPLCAGKHAHPARAKGFQQGAVFKLSDDARLDALLALIDAECPDAHLIFVGDLVNRKLALHAGTRICQIVLQRTEGRAAYAGRFRDQEHL